METVDYRTASFALVIVLLEEMSRDKNNNKCNLNN